MACASAALPKDRKSWRSGCRSKSTKPFPECSTAVQRKLGLSLATAFDLKAVCRGLVYALAVANNFLMLNQARTALVAQSMGGWAAVGAAVRAPERFWAIALANTVGNLTDPEIAALRQKLTAASPPRPPVLLHAALGETFRK